MVVDALTIEENAYSGFSHQIALTYADLAAQANGATATFTLGNLVAKDLVLRGALVVDTNFVFSDATILSATVSIGDSVNGVASILSAQQVESGQTPIVAAANAVNLAFAAAATLTATVTVTATKNLNTATAGQLRILLSKNSLAKFINY